MLAMMDGWLRTRVALGLGLALGSGGLLACSETESQEVRQEVRQDAKVVAKATRETVERGVDRAKSAIDRVDMEPVRDAWSSTVQAVKPGSSGPEPTPGSEMHPLAGASEAIHCTPSGDRCTIQSAFAQRMRDHGAAVASQVRMHAVKGAVEGIHIDLVEVGSVPERLGFMAGDVITHVNGVALGPKPDAMALYLQARAARHFTVRYQRGGAERVLEVDVV